MEIEVTIDTKGGSTVLAVSTIEDLWHDYQHFRDAASAAPAEEPAFEQKRFLRAALMMFVAHCAAVVDRWCRLEKTKEGERPKQVDHFIRRSSLDLKCDYISKRANSAGLQASQFRFKELRNRIVHATDERDLEFFRALSPSLLKDSETEMMKWLDSVGRSLGHERFRSSSDAIRDFSAGDLITKSISTEPPSAI